MERVILYLIVCLFTFRMDSKLESAAGNEKCNAFDRFSKVFRVSTLPDYVVADVSNLDAVLDSTLRRKTPLHRFPLTEQDRTDLEVLTCKFDNEENIAGLAAPQIGISKRFIVFKGEDDAKMVWINPSYEKYGDEMDSAYERCFSVKGVTAPVSRPKHIRFRATDVNGSMIEGRAEGFIARVIQHETDHLNGILFIDLVPPHRIITVEEFDRRLKRLEKNKKRRRKQ